MRTIGAVILTVGVLIAVAAPQVEAGPRTYLVRPGDTLYRIALRYGVTVAALTRANGGVDPHRIRVGQILIIPDPPSSERGATAVTGSPPAGQARAAAAAGPAAASTSAVSAAVASASPALSAVPPRYMVQRGDTLYSIARRHGITVGQLAAANGLRSARIYPGQSLRIPVPAVPATDAPGAPTAGSAPPSLPMPEIGAQVTAPRPLRLRRGPKRYFTTLAIIARETPLRVLAIEGDWIQVQPPGSDAGWVPGDDLRDRPPAAAAASAAHGADIVREALRYLGTPYVWGGESAGGVDCSGFVYVVFSSRMPRLARLRSFDYFELGTPVNRADLRPGDLVFFTTYAPGPSHVGIYAGSGRFLHASSGPRRVVITPLDDPYYASRYLGARRLLAP